MSEHLNAGQISEWIAGERGSDAERHLNACAACRSQLEEFQATLAGFRSSVRGWSEAQYGAGKRPAWRLDGPARRAQPPLYWAAMAAAFCALMAILVIQGSAPHPRFSGGADSSTHTSIMDAALMRQVDTEVSQTVPDAMEPLMKLVSWDESTPAEGSSVSKESSKEKE